MPYVYDPPLSEDEKREMTRATILDLVYRTGFVSDAQCDMYIDHIKDIWVLAAKG